MSCVHTKIIVPIFILLISASFVSAGVVDRITGRATNSCEDSDGGENFYVKGVAKEGDKELSDYCQDTNHIMEAYCSPAGLGTASFPCPDGCQDGACMGKQPSDQTALPQEVQTVDKCIEAIPGHNNLHEDRVNIVFVAMDKDMIVFLTDVSNSIDYYGDNKGLLAIEPFKSNKDTFNFFYVDEIGSLQSTPLYPERDRLSSYCDVPHKLPIAFTNATGPDNAVLKTSSTFGRIEITAPVRPLGVVHEFGHAFGGLFDEEDRAANYLPNFVVSGQNRNVYVSDLVNCQTIIIGSGGKEREGIECAVTPESIADCEANAGWKDLIGNGCGKDGVIDCTYDTTDVTEEVCDYEGGEIVSCRNFSTPVLITPEVRMEVRCDILLGESKTSPALKSVSAGIMVGSGPSNYFSFGPYNEKLLCDIIKNTTGSAKGICDTSREGVNEADLTKQLKAESECNSNVECGSNLCIHDKCVSQGWFKRILHWFSRLFG